MNEGIQELLRQREQVAEYLAALDTMIGAMRALDVASANLSMGSDAMSVKF